MDFGTLLHTAQKNDKSSKNGSNYYKTKFEPPKKENKSKTLSSNIQKFLVKKEEEEKMKLEEARRKRDELLAMRDPKMTNKIKKMLKVIKSANKSVLEEAVDNENTAVTMAGPDQPDEDDYGYVSQEASAFYSKMMDKYKTIPEEDSMFAKSKKVVNHDLTSTKDRVRAAILRHQEEEAQPHKRKRRSHKTEGGASPHEDSVSKEGLLRKEEKKEEKPKARRPAPPPLDFNELLKIAEKKQFEPVVMETKKPEKVEEPERLMTKRQKKEYEEIKALKEQKLRREKERSRESSLNAGKLDMRKSNSEALNNTNNGNKPANPLSMRIPKIGEKASNAPNSSKTEHGADRNMLKHKQPAPESFKNVESAQTDKNIKKEAPKSSDRKMDFSKYQKPSFSKNDRNTNIRNHNSTDSHPASSSSALHKPKNIGLPLKTSSMDKYHEAVRSSTCDKSNPAPSHKAQLTSREKQHSASPDLKKYKMDLNTTRKQSGSSDMKSKAPSSKDGKRKPTGDVRRSDLDRLQTQKKHLGSVNPARTENPSNDKRQALLKSTASSEKKPMRAVDPKSSQPLTAASRQASAQKGGRGVSSADVRSGRPFPSADVRTGRPLPSSDLTKPRPFPPSDVKAVRQFPPADVQRSRASHVQEMRQKQKLLAAKRKIMDDDSEYDSELEDFIDDDGDDANDYSKHIKEIFGYDKSRYHDADEDDRNMESNFSQVMREEYISKKIGIMEDLEDMKMEAMEKKNKMGKRRRISDSD